MQLQNTFFNLPKEPKQINSKTDNNSSNCINSIISPNYNNNNLNENKEKFEEKNNFNKNLELIKKNILKLNKITDMEKSFSHINEKTYFSPNYNDNSKSKKDENLEDNFLDFNPNNPNIENNNNNDDINDNNFFNFSINNENKNTNKIINNNYNKEIIEKNNDIKNDTRKNSINEEESSNKELKSPKQNDENNKFSIKKFDPSKIKNERSIFFSIENSDSNFRKKTNNYHLKVRAGDWICPNCQNLNFSFRNKCNICGLPKENREQNNNHLQANDNISNNDQRPIMFNNININYIFNSIFPINNINIINNPIIMNNTNINNYYGNYNNYQIYYPCNVNIK
jgi:hypothetical protein